MPSTVLDDGNKPVNKRAGYPWSQGTYILVMERGNKKYINSIAC